MKKTLSLLFAAFVVSSFFATTVMADVKKGQKFYTNKLKVCEKDNIKNGGVFASKNDRDTWSEMKEKNTIIDQWEELCPSGKKVFTKMKKKELQDLYDFCWQYASDGDVPTYK